MALKAKVSLFYDEDKVSFLRMRIGGWDGAAVDNEGVDADNKNEEVLGLVGKGADVGARDLGKEHGFGLGVEDGRAYRDDVNVLESSVKRKEACQSKKARRDLRKRRSIQLHPHAIEREVNRRRARSGRVE